MASYFELLDQEELVVRDRLSGLREELARIHTQIGEAEDRLHQVFITREMLKSLPSDTQGTGQS